IQEIGSGQFGVVHLGYWIEKTKVAIKTIREGAMSEEDFIEEAQVTMYPDWAGGRRSLAQRG
uniref:Serine-threonine/tyrosine-protein kinase catalytic domain-containing protein n=1 Tax=Crocodylus porosus TaxID=8502 RepID=A0A7M4F3D6_CROPO